MAQEVIEPATRAIGQLLAAGEVSHATRSLARAIDLLANIEVEDAPSSDFLRIKKEESCASCLFAGTVGNDVVVKNTRNQLIALSVPVIVKDEVQPFAVHLE